jgi:antitoxin component of MazEF toxin-antitoxin module
MDPVLQEFRLSREQLLDALNVALVVGGSITIPHLRRAVRTLDALLAETTGESARGRS